MREPGALRRALGWYRALPLSGARPGGHGPRADAARVEHRRPFLGRAGIEASAQFVDAPYRLEVLDGISHWIPELAPDRVAELVTAHVKTA